MWPIPTSTALPRPVEAASHLRRAPLRVGYYGVFLDPALVIRPPLQVAISTGGRSPFMAAHLRRRLESELGPEWGQLTELVGELRDRLRAEGVPLERQNEIFARVPKSGALELL